MTVYVVQEVRNMNLLPALEFGKIEILLPEGQVVFSTQKTVQRLVSGLRKYTFEDYLLMIGDPAAIAMTAAVASKVTNGKFKLLKWDKQEKKYIPITVNINEVS